MPVHPNHFDPIRTMIMNGAAWNNGVPTLPPQGTPYIDVSQHTQPFNHDHESRNIETMYHGRPSMVSGIEVHSEEQLRQLTQMLTQSGMRFGVVYI